MAEPVLSAAPTRDQILEAAERVFGAQGFEGSTIKDLATAACVNSALLYYYFVDKERLYRAVLERVVRRVARRALARLEMPGTPEERLRRFIVTYVALFSTERHVWPLFLRQLADQGAAHAVEQIQEMSVAVFHALCEVIEEGQRIGQFRGDLDPRFGAISTISVVAHFFTAQLAIGVFLGGSPGGPGRETVRAFALHAADYALAALRVHSGRIR